MLHRHQRNALSGIPGPPGRGIAWRNLSGIGEAGLIAAQGWRSITVT